MGRDTVCPTLSPFPHIPHSSLHFRLTVSVPLILVPFPSNSILPFLLLPIAKYHAIKQWSFTEVNHKSHNRQIKIDCNLYFQAAFIYYEDDVRI